jgi:membrane protease YdiL (CAAX protease family)
MPTSKDLLVFFAIASLPIASFLLLGYPNTQFYVSLLLVSLVVIVALRTYNGHGKGTFLVYDENLNLEKLVIAVGGALGCLAIASLFTSAFIHSILFVPMTKLGVTYGGFTLPAFWTDILFTLVLVVAAEECTKLVIILALHGWLKDRFGATMSKWTAVGVAVGGWALLHTYSNPETYGGANGWVYLAAAFVCGLVMFLVLSYTHSLLASMIVHLVYNAVVIYMAYYPMTVAGLSIAGLLATIL